MADVTTDAAYGIIIALSLAGAFGVYVAGKGLYAKSETVRNFVANLSAVAGGTTFVQTLVNILSSFFIMLPDVLIAGGAMAGLATMELKYVIPSITAILGTGLWGIILAFLKGNEKLQAIAGQSTTGTGFFNLFAKPVQETVPSAQLPVGLFKGGAMSGGDRIAANLCAPQLIPGVGYTPFNLPVGQVALVSMIIIYVLDISINTGGGFKGNLIPASVGLSLPLVYALGTWLYGCNHTITGHLVCIAIGALLGGAAFLALNFGFPSYLPVSTPVSPNNPLHPNTPNAQCSAGGGLGATEEEYTCDLYMNGKRVTSAAVPT